MPRNPTYADLQSATVEHVIKLNYYNGSTEQTLKLSTASQDIDVDVGSGTETFSGTGVLMGISNIDESADMDAPGVDITFDGVDQTIISVILSNQFRGRKIKAWRIWLDPSDGSVLESIMVFDGYQNEAYSVSESQTELPDAVAVSTRCVSRLTKFNATRSVKTNVTSHNELLERAGVATGDLGFEFVPAIQDKEVYWGRSAPVPGFLTGRARTLIEKGGDIFSGWSGLFG